MVCGNHIYESVGQSLAQRLPVLHGLYRRIALYLRAKRIIVLGREHEVGYTSLSRDTLLLQRSALEEFKFLSRRQMRHMKPCPSLLRHSHSKSRRRIASLRAPYARMVTYREIILSLIFLLEVSYVLIDNGCVLTMRHYQQWRSFEKVMQCVGTVNKHIACAATHKHLYTTHTFLVQLWQQVDIVISRTEKEGVVHTTLLCTQTELLVKKFQSCCLGHCVRHLHIRSDTTSGSRAAFRSDVSFMRQSRFTEMHMVIYYSREKIQPRGINNIVIRHRSKVSALNYFRYELILNNNTTNKLTPFIDNSSIINYSSHGYKV